MCSLLSDVLRLRLAPGLAAVASTMQPGGLRDARAVVIARQEAAAHRRANGLPNCELSVGARFGYDGGRHARFLRNVSLATHDSRDWLLCHRILTGHRLKIRVSRRKGCIGTLPNVAPGGGGTVQGLSISGPLYGPIPVQCAEWVLSAVPAACSNIDPALLKAYDKTKDDQVDGIWQGCLQATYAAAWHIEKILSDRRAGNQCDDALVLDVASVLSQLNTDVERLLVIDMLADSREDAVSAIVDDLKLRFSSPWALTFGCQALSQGASNLGIVYECGGGGKTVAIFDGLSEEAESSAAAMLHNSGRISTHRFAI